ncbi:hypothetical protein BDV95DRAFT_610300 [Massariosphaeria phaeospora]|uniref:6-phosphogluconate dehydrogenase C-terminal domain-like protein n=1 Tax=Massariosphaeria phaeospora TaxID=100035 RepID=A0A7C8M4U9_9PLEO|nr:hypothetical protein BDV95DRAFT_610300 [Massariosphaeria phaeospora]
MSSPFATVGILSIGQMGLGIAQLLIAHNYNVLTNVSDRSTATHQRAESASLRLVVSDVELVKECDYILSIVPPRDAVATAARVIAALTTTPAPRRGAGTPLYYLDLNAISPSTVTAIAASFSTQTPEAEVRFIDGGIIGGPPSPTLSSPPDSSSSASFTMPEWRKPGIPLSGPFPLHSAPTSGPHLALTLNTQHLSPRIGPASGLKCCFAALSKGFTALALQSFTTASSLGVLPALEQYLDEYNPGAAQRARKGVTGCPGKAYRWVEEMRQIGLCFEEEGGWAEQARVFREVAGVFEGLARVVEERGGTEGLGEVDGVVDALRDGLEK